MGVIQRQGIKDSIVAYIGVALGAVNVLWIYPYFLKKVELGLFNFLVSGGMLLSMFVGLGANELATRYFPRFRDESGNHHGFLSLLLTLPLAGWGLLALLAAVFWKPLQHYLAQQDPLIQQYGCLVLPLALMLSLMGILAAYTKNFLRIVAPTALENLLVKVCTALVSALLFYGVLTLTGFAASFVGIYALVVLGMVGYLMYLGQWRLGFDWQFLDKPLLRDMGRFAGFSMLGAMSAGFLTWIDRVMIGLLVEKNALESVGIFSIVAYMGNVIDVPRRSLEKIAAPITADALQRQDLAHVALLYRKSSINQLIAGIFLFLIIWLNLDDLFRIMPNGAGYASGKHIVLILGAASLITMGSGINHPILAYSPYYQLNFYLLLVLAGLNVVFNYLFIRTLGLGITGAALATLASISIYSAAKIVLVWRKLGLQPFTKATLGALLAGAGLGLLFHLLWPGGAGNPYLMTVLRSGALAAFFAALVLGLRLSADLNALWRSAWARVSELLRR